MVKLKKKVIKTKKSPKKTTTTKKKTKKSEDFATMSVDSFLNQDFEVSDNDDDINETNEELHDDKHEINDNNQQSDDEIENHKQALSKLKDTDPEFYQFLQENDKKLLDFNLSDDDDDDNDNDDVEKEDDLHKIPDKLEVASDESDFEDDTIPDTETSGKITLKLLKKWEKDILNDKTNKTIIALTQAFHAALKQVNPEAEDEEQSPYTVDGSSVFNGVVQLCVLQFGPAVRRFLGLKDASKQPPHKCKKFNKIKSCLRRYFIDLLQILKGVSSPNIQTVLLKHLHYMSPFLVSYPNISKSILKRLINVWGTADEAVRVIAFFCILRITNNQRVKFLDIVLKAMYMTYVKNSKFVSLNTLAGLNFMRRSLVEMYALDPNISYQHVFLYIRQLAIHLRNAITLKKKENIQTVYNWQFINSLKLWGNLLGVTVNKPQLQQLIYPFVQVCIGTIKLIPTSQYYPLRFHINQILIDLSRDSGVYIPILPFIVEILNNYDFGKKHQRVSMKPLQFTCILRVSKSQMSENGFKDTIIDTIYQQLLEYLSIYSNSITFPDLSLFTIIELKQFVKKSTNSNYNRKMKQIMEKIQQNSQFIENERSKLTFNLTDFQQITGWESQIKLKNPPLLQYYNSWNKIHTIKKNKQLTNNDELGNYNLPIIKKKAINVDDKNKKMKTVEGPVELFPSDSEDDDVVGGGGGGLVGGDELKRKRGKRGGKNVNNKKKVRNDNGPVEDSGEKDIVEDLNVNDW